MWRDWTNWARVGVWLAAVVLFFVVMAGVGALVSGPARGLAEFAGSFGPGGSIALIAVIMGGAYLFTRWAIRRDQRRQIAETGTLDAPQIRRPKMTAGRWALITAPIWIAFAAVIIVGLLGP